MAILLEQTRRSVVGCKANYDILEISKTSATLSVYIEVELAPYTHLESSGALTVDIKISNQSHNYTIKESGSPLENDTSKWQKLYTKTHLITISGLSLTQENIQNNSIVLLDNNLNELINETFECRDIYIGSRHNSPVINSISLEERNSKLMNIGIQDLNNTWIMGLSRKIITVNATYDDNAEFSNTLINMELNDINNSTVVSSYERNRTSNGFLVQTYGSGNWVIPNDLDRTHSYYINAIYNLTDTLNGKSVYATTYDAIKYTTLTLNASAKRNGQTSNQVKISCNGKVFCGQIGSINQSIAVSYKPTITYSYYETGDESHKTTGTIPSQNITMNYLGETYSVNDYIIPGTNFNYLKSYKIEIKVDDNFSDYTTVGNKTTLSIPYGEPVWSEYQDRVRFKNIQVDGNTQTNQINGQTWDTATNNTTDTWVPVFASGNKLQHRVIPNTYNSTSPSLVSPTLSSTLKMVAGQSIEFYNGTTKYADISTSSQYKDLFLDSAGGYVYIRNGTTNIASFRTDGKIYNGSSVAYALTTDIATHFITETKEKYTGALASGSNTTLTIDISKSNYKPLGLVGYYCTGDRASYINVYAQYLDGTNAKVIIKNTHPSNALANNNTKVIVYVLYVSNS